MAFWRLRLRSPIRAARAVSHLATVRDWLPSTRYVVLYRHIMDVMASALDGAPWGFSRYAFGSAVAGTPDNWIAGLAAHWQWHTAAALQWEAANPGLCLRVRYEDLVTEPERTICDAFGFLGVSADATVVARGLGNQDWNSGPGDHKILDTTRVHAESIGRGRRVPASLIPAELRASINEQLDRLGYPVVGPFWNLEPETRRAGGPARAVASLQSMLAHGGQSASEELQCELPRLLEVIPTDGLGARWVIDTRSGVLRGDIPDGDVAVAGDADDLLLAISGDANLGELTRHGRVRVGERRSAGHEPWTDLAETAVAGSVMTYLRSFNGVRNGVC